MSRSLWIVLVALTALRAALAFVPSMWLWGANPLRFVAALPGWTLWGLGAVALLPWKWMWPGATAWDRKPSATPGGTAPASTRLPPAAALGLALGLALLVSLLPDRASLTGDVLLRRVASETSASGLAALYPQGMPLDLALHDTLPRALRGATGFSAGASARVLGILEAAALGLLAARLAGLLPLSGMAALAGAAILASGATLTLFAGYNKAFAELTLATLALGVFGLEAVRRGNGILGAGAALALALALHRLGLALIPGAVVCGVLWFRRHGRNEGWLRPAPLLAALLPLAVLILLGGRIAGAIGAVDAGNFVPSGAERGLASLVSIRRLADLVSVTLFLSPLAALSVLGLGPVRRGEPEAVFLGALLAPLLLFVPFFQPPQGLFRDWDALAPTAVALQLFVVWTLARAEALRASRTLAIAVFLGALAPTVQTLLLHHDLPATLARVEAYASEPPSRPAGERASAWDYLGLRYIDLGLPDRAARAFEHAAEAAPSPKVLREWATAERLAGRPDRARDLYRRLVTRKPGDLPSWVELAGLSLALGDTLAAREAAERALEIRPDEPRARALLEAIDGIE